MGAIDTEDQDGESYDPTQDKAADAAAAPPQQGGNPQAPFGAPSGHDELRAASPDAFKADDVPVVEAHYTLPGDKTPRVAPLTAAQFAFYLHPAKGGQWDKLMQTGIPATLQSLARQSAGQYMKNGAEGSDYSITPGQEGDDTQQTTGNTQDDVDPDQSPQPNDYGPGKDAYNRPDDGKFRLPSPLPPGGSRAALRMGDEARRAAVGYNAPHAQSLDAFPGHDMDFAGNTAHDNAIDRARRKRGLYAGDDEPIPGAFDKQGHYKGPDQGPGTNYGPEMEARADARFGKGNVGNEQARQQWMSDQEEKQAVREGQLNVAKQQGVNRANEARIKAELALGVQGLKNEGASGVQGLKNEGASGVQGLKNEGARGVQGLKNEGARGVQGLKNEGARDVESMKADAWKASSDAKVRSAQIQAAGRQAQAAAARGDKQMATQFGLYRGIINAGGKVPPKLQSFIEENAGKYGAPEQQSESQPTAPAMPQAQAPQKALQQTAQRPPNVPPGAKQYKGKWYTRGPNGEAVPVE